MAAGFQSSGFQNNGFQTGAAAPPTPTRNEDIGLKDLFLPPVVRTIIRWFGAVVLIGVFQWWMT